MIKFLGSGDAGLIELADAQPGCWISVVAPTPDEVAKLHDLGIPSDYLAYALDQDGRSRSERRDGALVVVIRIPHYRGEGSDVPYTTLPLGIVLTPKYLVTLAALDDELVEDVASAQLRGLKADRWPRIVLQILQATSGRYLSNMREMTRVIDQLEVKLQQSTRNSEVLELLKYQKSLTYFTMALKSNEVMLERLMRSQWLTEDSADAALLDEVLVDNRQAIEVTTTNADILSSMMDAFASIISNNLNGVIKLLASITIVLSLPTMVASFYGMNVDLPLSGRPWAFLGVLGLSFVVSAIGAFVFWRRDWL